MSLKSRVERLEESLPKNPDPKGALTEVDLQSLNNLHRVYGDGDAPPDWREVYPTKGDLDQVFEGCLRKVYGTT